MTKEELREHCERQVKNCKIWAKSLGQEPSGEIYEEHKLILDLIKSSEQQSILLDKVKQAREEIADRIDNYPDRNISEYEDCLAILDNLIESEGVNADKTNISRSDLLS